MNNEQIVWSKKAGRRAGRVMYPTPVLSIGRSSCHINRISMISLGEPSRIRFGFLSSLNLLIVEAVNELDGVEESDTKALSKNGVFGLTLKRIQEVAPNAEIDQYEGEARVEGKQLAFCIRKEEEGDSNASD